MLTGPAKVFKGLIGFGMKTGQSFEVKEESLSQSRLKRNETIEADAKLMNTLPAKYVDKILNQIDERPGISELFDQLGYDMLGPLSNNEEAHTMIAARKRAGDIRKKANSYVLPISNCL